MKLTSKEARNLLETERKKAKNDRWIDHCICVDLFPEIKENL